MDAQYLLPKQRGLSRFPKEMLLVNREQHSEPDGKVGFIDSS